MLGKNERQDVILITIEQSNLMALLSHLHSQRWLVRSEIFIAERGCCT